MEALINSTDPLNIFELSDSLFVSESTLKNDLKKVKEKLHAYDILLCAKGDLIWCEGIEENKRLLVNDTLHSEIKSDFANSDFIVRKFPEFNVLKIIEILESTLKESYLSFNDYALLNITLHICINLRRISTQYSLSQSSTILDNSTYYHIACSIVNKLKEEYDLSFADFEIQGLAFIIRNNTSAINPLTESDYNLESVIGSDCFSLVNEIICEVNKFYLIDLNKTKFGDRFSFHIANLLNRIANQTFTKNDLVDEIRSGYPLIYDISVFIANIIIQKVGLMISDDEIAYIAFHLGSAIGELNSQENLIRILLVSTKYYQLEMDLFYKIKEHFGNQILISALITRNPIESELEDIDLIISTHPISLTSIPVLVIHPFLGNKDVLLIQNMITSIVSDRKNHVFREKFKMIFKKELFFIDKDFKNKDDAIKFMTHKMMNLGLVNSEFLNEVLEREIISSTAFDNYAIPHSNKMDSYASAIAVSISKKPIPWGSKTVNFIFLISINKLERRIFKEIFNSLTEMLVDPRKVQNLLEVSSIEDLEDIFVLDP